ncbi:MAG: hypothetical protein IPJ65_05730 [Archangiaceae bacterium]|nr:hypothetical protein [Archangiaceae bacterium]
MAVAGCAHKKSAPPSSSSAIDLAGRHANYRDWRGQDACKTDPLAHWTDLEAMNALLTEYLAQTKLSADEPWTPEQIATLEASVGSLGPALDGLDSQASAVTKCKFPKTSGVDDDAKTADELSQAARKRLTDAPALLPKLKEKAELNKWKADQVEAQKTGKESWCPEKPKPGVPDVYYASSDETGKTEWLFCDDTKVFALEGGKPEVQVDDPKKKKPNAKGYVEAALKYPASEVQHAPKPGQKAAEGEKTEKPQG